MKILMELEIPDSDVATAQENGPGPDQDLAEWVVSHLNAEIRSYFTENLEFNYTLRKLSTEELYTYLHFNLRNKQ